MSFLNILNKEKVSLLIGNAIILEIDATTNVSHVKENIITSYPIQSGINITDHVVNVNPTITLDCVISNLSSNIIDTLKTTAFQSAIYGLTQNQLASAVVPQLSGIINNVTNKNTKKNQKYLLLNELYKNKILFKVRTGLELYDNVIIQNLNFKESSNTIQTLNFTMTLKQVKIVTTKTEKIDPNQFAENVKNGATAKVNNGDVSSETPSNNEKDVSKSILSKGISGVTSIWQ